MAKKNDNLVGQLLKKVEEKKAQIEKIKNPDYITNLSYPPGIIGQGQRINLNVADEETLFWVLTQLETMMVKGPILAERNGVVFHGTWYGYKLKDWFSDVVMVIKRKQSQRQVTELRSIEKKLNSLLSEDKRTNIELEKLSELLGD